jgi:alkaline phosphatase D
MQPAEHHAGTGFQNEIDLTFGPLVVYVKARPRDSGPADGVQFFGHVAVDGATEVMTVTLKDAADTALWSRQIEPQFATEAGKGYSG